MRLAHDPLHVLQKHGPEGSSAPRCRRHERSTFESKSVPVVGLFEAEGFKS